MYKRIPGTKDILPDEVNLWQKIEEISRKTLSVYNYEEIRPPLIEEESLFNRSLGQSSEIVQKQMFLIQNKDDLYALRPEGTASVVRAYVENSLDKTALFRKFYYIGPMFRLERPQKGRLRQFHHIGVEAIGSYDPYLDIEVISLADRLLRDFSVTGYKIKINTLGCARDKKEMSSNLYKLLKTKVDKLCQDCQVRLENNVLRILDCKEEACKKIVEKLEVHSSYLCNDCKDHFSKVKNGLDALGIKYELAHHLVRGLDYYTQTVFEISHPDLGAQDAIGAGGRYNNLLKEIDGPDTGAIGFALGIERLLLICPGISSVKHKGLVYLITLGQEARRRGINIVNKLREASIPTDTDYENKSLKGAMRHANDLGARFVLILGENELKDNTIMLKDMVSAQQKQVRLDYILEEVKC